MLIHVELVQIKLGWVRLEKVGKSVDHIQPDRPSASLPILLMYTIEL
jgi:hypothetical protein